MAAVPDPTIAPRPRVTRVDTPDGAALAVFAFGEDNGHAPLLFLHGEEDAFILPENSRRMAEATPGLSEFHLLPGAGHAESVLKQPELYREYLYAFLDRVGC